MIKVSHNDHDYVFVPKRSCWVSSINMVVKNQKKIETLRQIAMDLGHTEEDFKVPPSEMERYIKMLEQIEKTEKESSESVSEPIRKPTPAKPIVEKSSIKVKSTEPKKENTTYKKKSNVKLKRPGAVSLKGFFNKE